MPEIRIDRIIRLLIISRTSIEETVVEVKRSANVEIDVVKRATKEKSANTNGNAVKRAEGPDALSNFVCFVAVDNVLYQLLNSLQKT